MRSILTAGRRDFDTALEPSAPRSSERCCALRASAREPSVSLSRQSSRSAYSFESTLSPRSDAMLRQRVS